MPMKYVLELFLFLILVSSCGIVRNTSWKLERTGQAEMADQTSSESTPSLPLAASNFFAEERRPNDYSPITTPNLEGEDSHRLNDLTTLKANTLNTVNTALSTKLFQHPKQVKKVTFDGSETELDKIDRVRVRYKVLAFCYAILTLGSIPFVLLAVEYVSAAFIIVPVLGLLAMVLAIVLGARSKKWVLYLREMERLQLSDADTANEEKPAGDSKRLRIWSIIGSIPVLIVGTALLLSLFSLLIF
jgi:hypothetical protein